MKSHYDTLGVPKTATHDEIKTAYRKLCMQTHPDVATSSINSKSQNAEKFKRISEAYSVIGNESARRRYDFEMGEAMRFGGFGRGRGASAGAGARAGGKAGGMGVSAAAALPRNILIGSMLGIAGVSLFRMVSPAEDEDDGVRIKNTGQKRLVEAWKNPKSGRWETPAPWDPEYQRLQPTLHFVPRSDVHERKH